MNKLTITMAALGIVGVCPACVHQSTPEVRAARVARMQCSDAQGKAELSILQNTAVLGAEPTYFVLTTAGASGGGTVNGAKLIVRPPPGVSALDMTRALQCHSAKMLLGQVDPSAFQDDPYSLPGAWVDIDVKPEDGNLAVRVTADRVPQNLALVHRAMAFADAHRTPAGQ
jgi:hypothetical protein